MNFTRTVNHATLYDKQQNIVQDEIPDRLDITWNLNESQVALLNSTPEVGNSRKINNSTLNYGVEGGRYKLSFWQDGAGNRNITFGDKFTVSGFLNLKPNSFNLIILYIEKGKGRIFINPDSLTVPLRLTSITLATANWVHNTTDARYEYDLINERIGLDTSVEIVPLLESIDAVTEAEIQPYTPISEGQIKIIAKNQPTADILVDLLIQKVQDV